MEKLQSLSAMYLQSIEMYQTSVHDGVEHGSPFMVDLRRVRRGMSPYELGSGLLSNALDAAHTLSTLWSAEALHSPTDFGLMRLVIDNALRAIWLTAPQDSDLRLQRAWRVACDSPFRAKRGAEAALRRDLSELDRGMYERTARQCKARLTEIDAIFTDAEVVIAKKHRAVEMAEIFTDSHISWWLDSLHVRRLWTLLSSMVHGELDQVSAFSITAVDPSDERVRLHNPDPDMLSSTGATVNLILVSAVYGFRHKMSEEPDRARFNVYSSEGMRGFGMPNGGA